jgi:hypothetical protein
VPALFNKLEARAGFRRRLDNRRRAGWDNGRGIRRGDKRKCVQRRRLILVRTLDFPFAGLVYMGVIMMMRVQVRVNQRSMIVGIAVTMDVLKRRPNKGRYKRQAAGKCENSPHQQTPIELSSRHTILIKKHTVPRNPAAGRTAHWNQRASRP